jgi:hypothetical protein
MVDDDAILQMLDKYHDDLDRAAKSLVSAANRGGGEDNITVVAFTIAADGADTVRLPAAAADEDTLEGVRIPAPAVDTMVVPPEQVERVFVDPGSPEAAAITQREPIGSSARVRLVLTMLVLLGIAAVLLVWGLVR